MLKRAIVDSPFFVPISGLVVSVIIPIITSSPALLFHLYIELLQ